MRFITEFFKRLVRDLIEGLRTTWEDLKESLRSIKRGY